MEQIGTTEYATNYLSNFFNKKDNKIIGIYENFKIDFTYCNLRIILENGYYFFLLYYKIGTKTKGLESKKTKEFSRLIKLIDEVRLTYTLDMERKILCPKKELIDRISVKNATNTLLGIHYENCNRCNDVLTVKSPCGHFYCSKCFYEDIDIFNDFTCNVCNKSYARIASKKIFETDREMYSDSDEEEFKDEELRFRNFYT